MLRNDRQPVLRAGPHIRRSDAAVPKRNHRSLRCSYSPGECEKVPNGSNATMGQADRSVEGVCRYWHRPTAQAVRWSIPTGRAVAVSPSRTEAAPWFGEEQDSTESRPRRALQTAPSHGGRRTAPPAVPSYARSPAWGDGGLPGLDDYRFLIGSAAAPRPVRSWHVEDGLIEKIGVTDARLFHPADPISSRRRRARRRGVIA